VTRLRSTLALAAALAAWAAVGGPAGSAAAHDAPATQALRPLAFAASRAHEATSHGRRKPSSCGSSATRGRSHAAHRSSCPPAGRKAQTRRTPSRVPAPKRVPTPRRVPASSTISANAEAAASEAAAIAKVLATPCQNTQLMPESANLPLVRAAVLCLINTERAENGREPLVTNSHLEQAAASHGQEMIAMDYFDHVSPTGLTPVERIRSTGYIPNSEAGWVIGENLAWGTLSLATPQAIVNAWMNSPEHRANILEGKYRDTGIDVEPEVPSSLAEGAAGGLYTQEFGVIIE
jgi:uncharacterized protein YkwD